MRRNFKKIALTIFVLTMTFSPITTFANTVSSRAVTVCPRCYNPNARLVCNGDYSFEETRFHGSCPYNVFTCTLSVDCDNCNQKFLFDNGRHECRQSHTGCALGVISVCSFRV